MQSVLAANPSASIIIVDDHPLFRGALKNALQNPADERKQFKIQEAGNFADALTLLDHTPEADLILLDLAMPGVSGFAGLVRLRAEYAGIPVIVVSAREDGGTIHRALELGASGYVPKSSNVETIRGAIDAVLQGDIWFPDDLGSGHEQDPEIAGLIQRVSTLTPQQTRVLSMLGEGLLNKQIAFELGVSEATVKAHVSAVLQKLGVDSRTQAVISFSKIDAGSAASL